LARTLSIFSTRSPAQQSPWRIVVDRAMPFLDPLLRDEFGLPAAIWA
jgi:hypothetical protein